jgi:hypothetical protein
LRTAVAWSFTGVGDEQEIRAAGLDGGDDVFPKLMLVVRDVLLQF